MTIEGGKSRTNRLVMAAVVGTPIFLTTAGVVLGWQKPSTNPAIKGRMAITSTVVSAPGPGAGGGAVNPGGGLAPIDAPGQWIPGVAREPRKGIDGPRLVRPQIADWRLHPYEGTKLHSGTQVGPELAPGLTAFMNAYSKADLIPAERIRYFDWLIDRADSLRVIGWKGKVQSFTKEGRNFRAVVAFFPLLSSSRAGKATYTPDRILETYTFANGKFTLEGVAEPPNRLRMLFHH